MLRIGFDEYNFHSVYPTMYLDDKRVGDVTINKTAVNYTVYDFDIYLEYRDNYYAPKLIQILETQAKLGGFKLIKLQWIHHNKIASLSNKGYKLSCMGKEEISVVKEL